MVKRNGGRVEGDKVQVKVQTPEAAKLELWDDYGSPVERIEAADARWHWKGNWARAKDGKSKTASDKGAESTIAFEGTGAIVTGAYLPTGGRADVYLDGKLDRTVDVYPDEDHAKTGESVWHAFSLKNGKHELRLVVRGEPYANSKGKDIEVRDLIVFR
jgi:hypothetical protein